MIYTMVHIASIAGFDPTWMIAASTGNVAEIYGLNSGFLRPGRDADVVIIDAPLGATRPDALSTMSNGDPVAIGAVITDGIPRFVGRSRNTPPTTREGRRRPLRGAGHILDVSWLLVEDVTGKLAGIGSAPSRVDPIRTCDTLAQAADLECNRTASSAAAMAFFAAVRACIAATASLPQG